MRALVRWTVGPCQPHGFDCLRASINLWRRYYGDAWDYAVCYNGPRPEVPPWVEVIDQRDHVGWFQLPPKGPAWKLYPPRLRPEAHELVIDNDLLLYRPHPFVADFLGGDRPLTTEAYRRCYGAFDSLAPEGTWINTGMIGLPPGYDLEGRLRALVARAGIAGWDTHFCEQGLVACALENPLIIPRTAIAVGVPDEFYRPGTHGIHFVGMNSGYSDWWNAYLSSLL